MSVIDDAPRAVGTRRRSRDRWRSSPGRSSEARRSSVVASVSRGCCSWRRTPSLPTTGTGSPTGCACPVDDRDLCARVAACSGSQRGRRNRCSTSSTCCGAATAGPHWRRSRPGWSACCWRAAAAWSAGASSVPPRGRTACPARVRSTPRLRPPARPGRSRSGLQIHNVRRRGLMLEVDERSTRGEAHACPGGRGARRRAPRPRRRHDSASCTGTSTSFENPTARNSSSRSRSAGSPTTITSAGSNPRRAPTMLAYGSGISVRRVEHHRAEVLVVDRATRRRGRGLSTMHPTLGDLRRRAEAREPAVGQLADPAQLARCPTAEPHVERLLHRPGADRHALVVEARAVVVDGVLGPEPADQRERLVEPRRALLAGDAERLLLVRLDHAEPERRAAPGRPTARRGSPTAWRAAPGCARGAPARSCRA